MVKRKSRNSRKLRKSRRRNKKSMRNSRKLRGGGLCKDESYKGCTKCVNTVKYDRKNYGRTIPCLYNKKTKRCASERKRFGIRVPGRNWTNKCDDEINVDQKSDSQNSQGNVDSLVKDSTLN